MEENSQSLSTLIADTMRIKGMSVEKLSGITGISDRALNGLIDGQSEKLPSAPYVHGYLLKIASVLSLDGESLWADYVKHNGDVRRSGKKDRLPENRFAVTGVRKKTIWVALLVLVIVGYLIARFASSYQKPYFEIKNLGENTHEPTVSIRGMVDPNAKLTLENEVIYPDKDGNFEKTIPLEPGVNVLVFRVSRLFGKEFEVRRQIIFEPVSTTTKNF